MVLGRELDWKYEVTNKRWVRLKNSSQRLQRARAMMEMSALGQDVRRALKSHMSYRMHYEVPPPRARSSR